MALKVNFAVVVNIFDTMIVEERNPTFDPALNSYPGISEEEAQEKVARSLREMSHTSGKLAGEFFGRLLEL